MLYGDMGRQFQLELRAVSPHEFAIRFPKNIEFDIFCYLINYLSYPIELPRSVSALGWGTVHQKAKWVPIGLTGIPLILYVSPGDTRSDNLHLVTEAGEHYVLSLSKLRMRRSKQLPERSYQPAPSTGNDENEHSVEFFRS